MEPLLAEELASIGASHIKTLNRSVYFEGGMDVLYRANYYCRTALRILWRVKCFNFKIMINFTKKSTSLKLIVT